MNTQNNSQSAWSKMTNSITFKAVSIGFLILLLLIPVSMVQDLIRERRYASESVEEEVSSKWGHQQTFTGPILKVPYTYTTQRPVGNKGNTEIVEVDDYAYFLPEELGISTVMAPEILHRSIYDVVVYQAKMVVRGHFSQPDFSQLNIQPVSVDWDNACLYIGISDMRGVRNKVVVNWNNTLLDAVPGIERSPVLESGVTVKTPLKSAATAAKYTFNCELLLNGSKSLAFTPLGKSTKVETSSTWATPGFDGAFLPDNRNISAEGFAADWSVFNYNRNYPQAWVSDQKPYFSSSNFSVNLVLPVDHYQQSTRAVKYAVMFIVLTFLMFFMVELISRKPVHILQYLLISAGLIIFYSLLLAMSEQMNFTLAYIISAVAIVALITSYSYSIFKRWTQTLMAGSLFGLLYLYLYVVLQMEDLALLIGSIGLFVVLAVIMYVSRKINWFR